MTKARELDDVNFLLDQQLCAIADRQKLAPLDPRMKPFAPSR